MNDSPEAAAINQTAPADEWAGIAADHGPSGADDAALYLTLDSWEGPLALLLDLARRQKVDLRQISILALVDQYLAYVDGARALRLELAADYLVMAAWLAYLKSLLLLPREPGVEPSPEELAFRLQMRLQRLEAMRQAAAQLLGRNLLRRDVFPRGAPEGLRVTRASRWEASWFDLIQSYGQLQARNAPVIHMVRERPVMTLESALQRVSQMLGVQIDWASLESFLPAQADRQLRRSALASCFVAALELARQGKAELDQREAFAPLMLRAVRGGRPPAGGKIAA